MSDYINQDLLTLFLKRLPVKTILQFRIVCKSWKQLIDSTPFILNHLAIQTPRLIAHNKPWNYKYLLIDPQTFPSFQILTAQDELRTTRSGYYIVSTLHGIICLRRNDDIALWNPSIRRVLFLPLPDGEYLINFCSFWIDPSTKDYKAVIISLHSKTIAVFSSSNKEWRGYGVTRIGKFTTDTRSRQLLINGVAYWVAFYRNRTRVSIFSYGFKRDGFSIIPLPAELMESDCFDFADICKWKDFLSVANWKSLGSRECSLWVMRDGLWSKMFRFDLMDYMKDVIYVFEGNGRVLAQKDDGDLVLHDPKDERCISLKSEFVANCEFSVAYDYVESLVFPDEE